MAPHEFQNNLKVNQVQVIQHRDTYADSYGHTMAPYESCKTSGGHDTKLLPRKGGGDGNAQHVVDILSNPRDLVPDTKQVPDVDFILDPGGLNPNSKSYNSNSKSYGGCGGGRSRSCGALKVRRQGNISNQKCQRRYRANRGRFRANRSRFHGTIKDNGARVPKEKPKLVEGHFVPVVLPE